MVRNSKGRGGQSSVELLNVYAWAGFAVIISVAALAYFGAFDSDKLLPTSCDAGGGIQCLEASIDANSGQMTLDFRNNLPDDIVIKEIVYEIDGQKYTTYPEAQIPYVMKGSKVLIMGPVLPADTLKQSKKKVTFIITYSRRGSTAIYQIQGNGVVEILPKEAVNVTNLCNHNGHCDAGENFQNCAYDCEPPVVCGDGICDVGENIASCPADCGLSTDAIPPNVLVYYSPPAPNISVMVTVFANATDDSGYVRNVSIYVDGSLAALCAGGNCSVNQFYPAGVHTFHATASDYSGNIGRWPTTGEGSFNVTSSGSVCGNLVCEVGVGENLVNCPADCYPVCGNSVCDWLSENYSVCPADCPNPAITPQTNLIMNPSFELGISYWGFVINTAGSFSVAMPGYDSPYAANVSIFAAPTTHAYMYQNYIPLESLKNYTLSFAVRSTFGHDFMVNLTRNSSPGAGYGLSGWVPNISTSWAVFSKNFTTPNLGGNVTNGYLNISFMGYAFGGETYFFDNVTLKLTGAVPPDTVAPSILISHTPAQVNITKNVTLNASASDANGISKILVYLDNSLVKECMGTKCNYTTNFSTTGIHTYYAIANDTFTNMGRDPVTGTKNFTVVDPNPDLTAPALNVTHTPSFPRVIDDVTVTATATDASGLSSIIIYVDGQLAASCAASPCSTPKLNYSAGGHTYYATARDTKNNTARDPSAFTRFFNVTLNSLVDNNLIANPSFENGTSSWVFLTDGNGTFRSTPPGYDRNNSANITIQGLGYIDVELYQSGIELESYTNYTLAFWAKSNSGDDMRVYLHKNDPLYDNYGVSGTLIDLKNFWNQYSIAFLTPVLGGNVSDGRLRFWLTDFNRPGDIYNIDNVTLIKSDYQPIHTNALVILQVSRYPIVTYDGQLITFNATTNNTARTAVVNLYVDGLKVKTCTPVTGPCAYSNTYSGGTHTYYADGFDINNSYLRAPASGNYNFDVSSDTSPPVVNYAIYPAIPTSTDYINITFNSTDESGINYTQMFYNGIMKMCYSSTCSMRYGPFAAGTVVNFSASVADNDYPTQRVARVPFAGDLSITVAAGDACTWDVAPSGSDSNDGSMAHPFRTMQKAADVVNPGDVVCVTNGTYIDDDSDNNVLYIRRSGAIGNWITFRSVDKQGASIDCRNTTSFGINFLAGVSYVGIYNFDIRNCTEQGILAQKNAIPSNPTHDIIFKNNSIHDIARFINNGSFGLDGIYVGSYNHHFTFDSNIWYNIGRIGPSDYWLNKDHSIYLSPYDNEIGGPVHDILITNNIFYFNSGGAIAMGADNSTISNNIFAWTSNNTRGGTVLMSIDASNSSFVRRNILIQNNIFFEPPNSGDGPTAMWTSSNYSNVVLNNNIVYGGSMWISAFNPNFTMGNNWCQANCNHPEADPLFVNAHRGIPPYDFHLTSSSPARDSGISAGAPPYDYDGKSRPVGAGYDIGAYEYG